MGGDADDRRFRLSTSDRTRGDRKDATVHRRTVAKRTVAKRFPWPLLLLILAIVILATILGFGGVIELPW